MAFLLLDLLFSLPLITHTYFTTVLEYFFPHLSLNLCIDCCDNNDRIAQMRAIGKIISIWRGIEGKKRKKKKKLTEIPVLYDLRIQMLLAKAEALDDVFCMAISHRQAGFKFMCPHTHICIYLKYFCMLRLCNSSLLNQSVLEWWYRFISNLSTNIMHMFKKYCENWLLMLLALE